MAEISVSGDLTGVIRASGGQVLAVLARSLGDLGDAEDAWQDAVVAAMEVWPRTGTPANPAGWLYVAARRKALDRRRSEARRAARELNAGDPFAYKPDLPEPPVIADDQLRLLFTVCHPALDLDAQVTLALKLVAGLSVTEIAHGLLLSEAAVARRLTRAKTKIRTAAIGRSLPSPDDLGRRTAGVLNIVHIIYTTGHASPGDELLRHDLCDEGVRLARLVRQLLPSSPEAEALLALVLLTDARRTTRLGGDGTPTKLEDQDRSRWDRAKIAEGVSLLDHSLARTEGQADPYQLQAAIAAAHATAVRYQDTDWPEIVRLYALLSDVHPSPAVAINHAVAIAQASGPHAGLRRLQSVAEHERSHRWHLAHGELLASAGESAADAALDAAQHAAPSDAERRAIAARRRELAADAPVAGPLGDRPPIRS